MANARYVPLSESGFEGDAGDLRDADDTTLALALKAGDSRAPRTAWIRFAPLVSCTLRRTFGPGHDIEDVQQDIFMAFFRKVSDLREPRVLRAFLMSITVRTIKHRLRRARAGRFIRLWESTDSVESADRRSVEGPDNDTIHALRVFYAVLDKLSAHDRTLFGLRFLDEMELVDVAEAMGISVSTTKRHAARIWKWVARRIRNEPALASDHVAGKYPFIGEPR